MMKYSTQKLALLLIISMKTIMNIGLGSMVQQLLAQNRVRRIYRNKSMAALFLSVLLFVSQSIFASDRYFVQTGSTQRYSSAGEICESYRQYIESANATNPGGSTTIKTAPSENLYPNLKNYGICTVTWSRDSSSFDYSINMVAGGCLDGRSPKPGTLWPSEPDNCVARTFNAVLPPDSPAPSCSGVVGNPIDSSTGKKYQFDTDIPGKGIGQISLDRYYSNANIAFEPVWHHSYDKRLIVIDPTVAPLIRQKSNPYADSSIACLTGWNDIKSKISDGWAVGAGAVYSNGSCQITRSGVVVKTLPILASNAVYNYMTPGAIQLRRPNGSTIEYQSYNTAGFSAISNYQGKLQHFKTGDVRWRYSANTGDIEEYSAEGRLLFVTALNGMKQSLIYDSSSGLLSHVQDTTGSKLRFAYTNGLLTSVTTDDNKVISYAYTTNGLMSDVTYPDTTRRLYHYEDLRFPTFLTGITDERGVRYATWAYDTQGRAISSEHAGGVEKTLLSFNADNSTTVTNSLGKKTIYHFADIAGARRVVKVEGQPTTNCMGANQDYTYTPEGWVASKTDWKGSKTTFTYNTLGQEITRIEGFGTLQARTTATEWHPTFSLKTKVTEFDKETVYTYDLNGLLTNQKTRSLTTP